MKAARAGSRGPTLRDLNRATLARQMLLVREKVTALSGVERLVALQAQWPRPPFIGLWSRVRGFRREDLARLFASRQVVRATSMRGTLHVMSARDFAKLRAAVQPSMTRGALAVLGQRAKGADVDRVVAEARALFEEKPYAFEDLRDHFATRFPKSDVRALAYLVRTHLPLVQVPNDSSWSFPAAPVFALAESWLGKPIAKDSGVRPLVLRYLAAYGPAKAVDVATWSGLALAEVRDALEACRSELVVLALGQGKELFDAPASPRPGGDAPAPARFLPEFDHLMLAHADRTRFVPEPHRRRVFLPGLRVAATFLVDGFVAGAWKVERKKDAVTLAVQPFAALSKAVRDELAEEGVGLARFLEGDAKRHEVKFVKAAA